MKIRLNRYLSECGVASRRKADDLIKYGEIIVNGKYVAELGTTVDPERDTIELNGEIIKPEKKRYLILNKPKLYITAIGQGEDEKKTLDELIEDIPERVFPVGRLDYDVDGLIILTNDGELANKITHPRYELEKVYLATVRGSVSQAEISKMRRGVRLEDGQAKPDTVKVINRSDLETSIAVSFHEGRNRLVKRFFAEFDHPVTHLKRISVGPIRLGDLPRGKHRDLTAGELRNLIKATGK